MKIQNTHTQYGLISVTFHWLFALAIVSLLASGLYMVTLTYYHPWYHPLPHYHKLIGIGTIGLFTLRTVWHFLHRQPKITATHWELKAAKATHYSMLILSGITLITGYAIISVDATIIEWLNLKLPILTLPIQNQADQAGVLHQYCAYGLLGFITLHIGATLKHQYIDKHKLLQKILGFKDLAP